MEERCVILPTEAKRASDLQALRSRAVVSRCCVQWFWELNSGLLLDRTVHDGVPTPHV